MHLHLDLFYQSYEHSEHIRQKNISGPSSSEKENSNIIIHHPNKIPLILSLSFGQASLS